MGAKSSVFYCTSCMNMSTRPRITFDSRGWCNACQWAEEKKTLDWSAREKELKDVFEKYCSKTNGFDCVVPCSGGKDGSYVAYNIKHKYGLNPLTVTVQPPLTREVGNKNIENFKAQGYDHIYISPNSEIMRTLNRIGFADMGFGYYGWLVTVFSTVIRVALAHNCSLIFYAEDGEVEYGGSTENKNKSLFGLDYMKAKYFEGGYEKVMNQVSYTDQEMYYWKFPKESELVDKNLFLTHWGYFEDWDPYRNYLVAKEHCGLQELESRHIDTFQNFGQTDQMLIHLHVYMMYLKLGFGRTTQDVGIEVRRNAMTRDQAVNLVRLYDGTYPEECIDIYLDYFQITQEEFDSILDKWANKELFEKIDNRWKPKFIVK